jgi:hypothetical protein
MLSWNGVPDSAVVGSDQLGRAYLSFDLNVFNAIKKRGCLSRPAPYYDIIYEICTLMGALVAKAQHVSLPVTVVQPAHQES